MSPTNFPSNQYQNDSAEPSFKPTIKPTNKPSTSLKSSNPTKSPTSAPSLAPSLTPYPSYRHFRPTEQPTTTATVVTNITPNTNSISTTELILICVLVPCSTLTVVICFFIVLRYFKKLDSKNEDRKLDISNADLAVANPVNTVVPSQIYEEW
eukprot:gene20629-26746_t